MSRYCVYCGGEGIDCKCETKGHKASKAHSNELLSSPLAGDDSTHESSSIRSQLSSPGERICMWCRKVIVNDLDHVHAVELPRNRSERAG